MTGPLDYMAQLERRQEAERQIRELEHASFQLQEQHRVSLVEWAAVMCACRPWFDWNAGREPAAAGCPVHGSVVVTPDGRVI